MNAPSSRPERYSLWDTVACLGTKPTLRRLWSGTPSGVRLQRARMRTGRFVRAAASLGGEFRPSAIQAAALAGLAEDYRHRAAQWESQLHPEADGRSAQGADQSGCLDGDTLPLGLLNFAEVFWVLPVLLIVLAIVAAPMIPVLLAPPLVFAFRRRRVRGRLRLALSRRCCPDCGYDLRGLDAALPPSMLGGTDVGPDLCPECGSPWPLVPPPFRGERR
jgi:hypothetical protein